MKYLETSIKGLFTIEPKIYCDNRGYFFESFKKEEFTSHIGKFNVVQENQAWTKKKGVIRGLHFQKDSYAQAKLVRVIKGKVWDLALDLRKESQTFGKYLYFELSEENNLQLFIPRGFAHAYQILSNEAILQYKVDNYYAPEYESGIRYDDTDLSIPWPLEAREVSDKDKNMKTFKDFLEGKE